MKYLLGIFSLQLKLICLMHINKKPFYKNLNNILLLVKNVLIFLYIFFKVKIFLWIFLLIFFIYHVKIIYNLYQNNKKSNLHSFLIKNRYFFNKFLFYFTYFLSLIFYLTIEILLCLIIFYKKYF